MNRSYPLQTLAVVLSLIFGSSLSYAQAGYSYDKLTDETVGRGDVVVTSNGTSMVMMVLCAGKVPTRGTAEFGLIFPRISARDAEITKPVRFLVDDSVRESGEASLSRRDYGTTEGHVTYSIQMTTAFVDVVSKAQTIEGSIGEERFTLRRRDIEQLMAITKGVLATMPPSS